MLVKQEMISKVKDYFDLNIYETKVWLALLSKGIASAGEIANLSRVPRSRTYDVLESLEKKGFAIAKIGKPVKYMGVKPKIILEKIKGSVKKEAEEKIQRLTNIKETGEFLELERIYKGNLDSVKRENLSLELKGKSNISGYVRGIIQKARKEVIVCTDAEDMKAKLRTFRQTFEILKNSGINVLVALSGEEDLIKHIENSLELQIKRVNLHTKFFIVDRREILFYLSKGINPGDSEGDIAVWINSNFFTEAFTNLFDMSLKSENTQRDIQRNIQRESNKLDKKKEKQRVTQRKTKQKVKKIKKSS